MKMLSISELTNRAKKCAQWNLTVSTGELGGVGCALLTKMGNVYEGVSIDVACGIGFCAEHSAVANMVSQHETEIAMIVAVNNEGAILSPCGRCRELLSLINPKNRSAKIVVKAGKTVTLSQLLPFNWEDSKRLQ